MFEANKLLKSKVKSLSLELVKSPFNWVDIRTTLMDLLDTILSANATVAAHCVLALGASLSFSLRLKQLLRESVNDCNSVQLLVANLFTIGCEGDGDSADVVHSVCSAGEGQAFICIVGKTTFCVLFSFDCLIFAHSPCSSRH